jgi:fumarate reductase (CoM/CoB) subunit A
VTGGLHGANRLGGNSLAETIVFGKIAGRSAHKFAKGRQLAAADYTKIRECAKEIHVLLGKESYYRPSDLKKELQEVMWKNAGILRNRKDLETARRRLTKLQRLSQTVHVGSEIAGNQDLVDALDVRSLLFAAEAVVKSALLRKESRGAHFRTDHPRPGNAYLCNFVCARTPRGMAIKSIKAARPKGPVAKELKRSRTVKHGFVE